MPQVRGTGTAWVRSLEDYAYTKSLDRPGWAWEFLRRNETYRRDVRINRAGVPVAIRHKSGAVYCRLRRRSVSAELWGLVMFADPHRPSTETAVFWHPGVNVRDVSCSATGANNNHPDSVNLGSFRGRTAVLVANLGEHVAIQNGQRSARLTSNGISVLIGTVQLTFHIRGLDGIAPSTAALFDLRRLGPGSEDSEPRWEPSEQRLLERLVALDGHLEGRTYRDIAEVLYGADRVKEVWTNETRHLKDKVRRAVASGIELMNSGYRKLL